MVNKPSQHKHVSIVIVSLLAFSSMVHENKLCCSSVQSHRVPVMAVNSLSFFFSFFFLFYCSLNWNYEQLP